MFINYVCEDAPSRAVAEKLIKQQRYKPQDIGPKRRGQSVGGRSPILSRLDIYNERSKLSPIVLFIDLDDSPCAPSLLAKYPIRDRQSPQKFQIRIAVREVESWLLADRQGFAKYFGISQGAIPPNPETLPDPKRTLLNLIKEKASGEFKRGMLSNGRLKTGSRYNLHLTHFINTEWNSTRACANANSLTRAINGIRQITP